MTGIEPLGAMHVPYFFSAADAEGWICDPWEFAFLLNSFPQGCWTAVRHGVAVGFVTAARYEKSGWIGNLLVRKEMRGRGQGRALFERALHSLEHAGAETVWLTASLDGQPLYEKLGFAAVDRIIRWRGRSGGHAGRRQLATYSLEAMEETDRMGWGDCRGELLLAIAERGIVMHGADGFCILQVTGERVQLGPWGCRQPEIAESLLQQALEGSSPSAEIVLDAPESNRDASEILERHGFSPCGATTLMYRGSSPDYNPRHIFALASMGSIG